jgi:hypothetical protein
MIYDQPEILDQDIQLDHYDDRRNLHYPSSRTAVTKQTTHISPDGEQYIQRRV